MADAKVDITFTRTTADYCRTLKTETDIYLEKTPKARGLIIKKQEKSAKWLKSTTVDELCHDAATRDIFKGCRATALHLLSRGVGDISRLYSTAEKKRQLAHDFLSKRPAAVIRATLTLMIMDPEVRFIIN